MDAERSAFELLDICRDMDRLNLAEVRPPARLAHHSRKSLAARVLALPILTGRIQGSSERPAALPTQTAPAVSFPASVPNDGQLTAHGSLGLIAAVDFLGAGEKPFNFLVCAPASMPPTFNRTLRP